MNTRMTTAALTISLVTHLVGHNLARESDYCVVTNHQSKPYQSGPSAWRQTSSESLASVG